MKYSLVKMFIFWMLSIGTKQIYSNFVKHTNHNNSNFKEQNINRKKSEKKSIIKDKIYSNLNCILPNLEYQFSTAEVGIDLFCLHSKKWNWVIITHWLYLTRSFNTTRLKDFYTHNLSSKINIIYAKKYQHIHLIHSNISKTKYFNLFKIWVVFNQSDKQGASHF